MIHLILLTGISGSGKSVALRLLEDIGYICIDNLPVPLLLQTLELAALNKHQHIAIAIDAKTPGGLDELPKILYQLRNDRLYEVKTLFLEAATSTLVARYSESRRPHPLSEKLRNNGSPVSIEQCIEFEREMLEEHRNIGLVIDTSNLSTTHLRQWIKEMLATKSQQLLITFQSFAFKHGTPSDADFLFDVRCLPNPFYEPALRPLTGKDQAVQDYFLRFPLVQHMQMDIQNFLLRWLPSFEEDTRAYINIAIGCTGGQHRSVFIVEQLANSFKQSNYHTLIRHRSLAVTEVASS